MPHLRYGGPIIHYGTGLYPLKRVALYLTDESTLGDFAWRSVASHSTADKYLTIFTAPNHKTAKE